MSISYNIWKIFLVCWRHKRVDVFCFKENVLTLDIVIANEKSTALSYIHFKTKVLSLLAVPGNIKHQLCMRLCLWVDTRQPTTTDNILHTFRPSLPRPSSPSGTAKAVTDSIQDVACYTSQEHLSCPLWRTVVISFMPIYWWSEANDVLS